MVEEKPRTFYFNISLKRTTAKRLRDLANKYETNSHISYDRIIGELLTFFEENYKNDSNV